MNLPGLIHTRNRCLERLLDLSSKFLAQTEDGALPDLAPWQAGREAIFKALDLFDRKINSVISELSAQDRTPALIESVKAAMERRDEITSKILTADETIIGTIETARQALLKDLSNTRKNREVLHKFKSTWLTENGDEVDRTL